MPAKKKTTRAKPRSALSGKIIALVPKGLGLDKEQLRNLEKQMRIAARDTLAKRTPVVAMVTCDVECIDTQDE